MRTSSRLVVAALSGALVGALWIVAHTPIAHPVASVVGVHVLLALGVERALALARLRSTPSLILAVAGALLLAPAFSHALMDAGQMGGPRGAAMVGVLMALGALAGGALGALCSRGARGAALGTVGVLGLCGGLWAYAHALPVPDEAPAQPRALRAATTFPSQKVAVIGIDGADWGVIDPMVAQGRLPTLAGLLSRGQSGVLRSIEPVYSPVLWTTIFTGQTPAVHGLVDWYSSDARNRKVPTLWDIFSAEGRSTLTVNVPGTWPSTKIDHGVLFSGFPIPGLTTGDRGQLLGTVASTERESGAVPTLRVRAEGGGHFSLDLPLAAAEIAPRVPGLRNAWMDLAVRKQFMALDGPHLRLSATVASSGSGPVVHLEAPTLREPIDVAQGSWSSWLTVTDPNLEAVLRVYVLAASDQNLRLYLTPAYQAPWAPRFPFATGADPDDMRYGEPYIVEGVGWKAVHDERVARLLPSALLDVEESHMATVERLMRSAPDLLSFVITITDRVQHPFWPLFAPGDYPDYKAPAGMSKEHPVENAMVTADTELARVLAQLPEDTLVMVVSDHGFRSDPGAGEGEHRMEGIWIAAGPMIAPSATRTELSVTDVTPTVLRCIGAPVARDFAGKAADFLCPSVPAAAPVDTWRQPLDQAAHDAQIDASREAQLRAMGYIDDDKKTEDRK